MKPIIGVFMLVTLLASAGVQANCRAADAAKVGGDAGLARDQAAATATAESERINSDTLGKCISGITSIVVVPTFPSLMSIFEAAATKMCKLASDAIPRLPPIGPGLGTPLSSSDIIPATAPLAISVDLRSPPAVTAPPSDFWSKIWR
jgi:TraL protein